MIWILYTLDRYSDTLHSKTAKVINQKSHTSEGTYGLFRNKSAGSEGMQTDRKNQNDSNSTDVNKSKTF